ncbi:SET domain-containing protein-lysine N-methyltransferase [Micromonospora sp. R77]|uniref:SET domain-containing protein n=1 Tax=Micromonospora sp. R77 TaxID=2925836 RepID=UPI001F61BBEC|nr:SET domain-containing protein [Micromonospora sp. R77]MCI4061622.1 SET domain-containing protein-lysine N-methyltransferase [Micromonospora sp. R77]
MIPVPEPDCWLHPDVVVGRSSIAGRGLFARVPMAAGEVVSRLGGRLVPTRQLAGLLDAAARDPARPYVDSITEGTDRHLVLPPRRPSGYGNHSCDPNLWWVGPYELATRREIAAGEELTNDYGTSTGEPGFTMSCRCGSALCRGVVTGDDWRLPALRERYGEHWVPGLLARIRGEWD